MYTARGSSGYGQQQPHSSQSPYTPQNLSASTLIGGGHQEVELGGYRAPGYVPGRPSAAAAAGAALPSQSFGGQYGGLIYSSGGQQGAAATPLDGKSNYGSSMTGSPRVIEYPTVERRRYSDHRNAYLGRDLPRETADRYADSTGFGHEQQSKLFDRVEQATLRGQEEMLKARTRQSASVEGGARQVDYVATRTAARLPIQDPIAYDGRINLEPRNLSLLSNSSYAEQRTSSILGAAPPRNVEDLVYARSSSNTGYGVGLPPGRDYKGAKGLLGTPLELDYPTGMLGRNSHQRLDDPKNDRATYMRGLEQRDRDRDYLQDQKKDREREKDWLRERERDRERERERERTWEGLHEQGRERECERERARQRERQRELERQRRERECELERQRHEREREREQREKDRDRERKVGRKIKQKTPRVSREHRGSSLSKDIKCLPQESIHHEMLHRAHSPVTVKRREYMCKVFSFSFVEAERDYLSLDKRYPRLYISPECSRVAVFWPKKNLHLSLYTPVSFEHDFIEVSGGERKGQLSAQPSTDASKSGGQTTTWNSKIILMSGLSEKSLAELSSERLYDDRIPHFCNMLRFSVLKQNNSLRAIGGPWDGVDGGDPSVDDSALIRTALRYAKDLTNLDLKDCQHWNRFLEIHYERVGQDGRFSHREVTVLYVPDLSGCLPSLEAWREQWLTHKKNVSEREHMNTLNKQDTGGNKGGVKDKKEHGLLKDSKGKPEHPQKKEPPSSRQSGGGASGKGDVADKMKTEEPELDKVKNKAIENSDMDGSIDEVKKLGNMESEISNAHEAVGTNNGKKKIVKRIVKTKVAKKKEGTENATEQNYEPEKEDAGGKNASEEIGGQRDGASGNPTKNVRESGGSAVRKADCSSLAGNTAEKPQGAEGSPDVENHSAEALKGTKSTIKKKVVTRVPKSKVISADNDSKVAENDTKTEEMKMCLDDIKEKQNKAAAENRARETLSKETNSLETDPLKKEEEIVDKKDLSRPGMLTDGMNKKVSESDNSAKPNEKTKVKDERKGKDHEQKDRKALSRSGMATDGTKQKVSENDKSGKPSEKATLEKEGKDLGSNSRSKTNRTAKEKKRNEEPPRHPGLILQTRGSKDAKLHSLSFSLDSLLDYSDKDIEESTFELSIFAESMYEMLQYEMGSRILAFLQKLCGKFIAKRNQRKRERKETSEKENEESSLRKRVKTDKIVDDAMPTKTENIDNTPPVDANVVEEGIIVTDQIDELKIEDKIVEEELEEDPEEDELEEDPEEDEDEEMPDAIAQDSTKEEDLHTERKSGDAVDNDVAQAEQNEQQETAKQPSEVTTNLDPSNKDQSTKVELKTTEAQDSVDNELLQAFRFFDRNRVGYIRVEDLRLIIHNLGKFLTHRNVKELVQSALLETNTARDDRILYEKLVRMTDI